MRMLKGGWKAQILKALMLFLIAAAATVLAAASDLSFVYEAF